MMRYRSYGGFSLGLIGYLIITNLILFIATLINGDLIYLFGLQPASFLAKPWTIITNLFIHGGTEYIRLNIGHILGNMITLYFFGSYLIQLIGERNFLVVYFLGGILGNILFILLGFPFSTVVGASGAVFALGGALTVMQPRLKVFIIPIPVPIPLWVAVIGGFLILSFLPLVAWQAHLGGLICGLIAGYIFRRRERRFFWTR